MSKSPDPIKEPTLDKFRPTNFTMAFVNVPLAVASADASAYKDRFKLPRVSCQMTTASAALSFEPNRVLAAVCAAEESAYAVVSNTKISVPAAAVMTALAFPNTLVVEVKSIRIKSLPL